MCSIKDQDTNKNVLVIKLNQFQSCQGNQAVNSIISRLTTDRIIATITEPLSTWLRFRACFEDNFLFADNQLLFFTRQFLRNLPQKLRQAEKNNLSELSRERDARKKYGSSYKKVWKSMEAATPWNPFLENVLKLDRLMQFRFKWTKHFPMKYICHHLLRTYPAAQTGLVVKNHMQSSFF